MIAPYYQDDHCTIYVGNCLDVMFGITADVMVTDPPYGISYESGHVGVLPRSIAGDQDTRARDDALAIWESRPALVFGSWRVDRPKATRALLVWDTKGALGMGALDLPWKPAHQEIYVLGSGFIGRRSSDVLTYAPVQSTARLGRTHPHEKPVPLLKALIEKCPPGVVIDPFMGTGSTLVAAKALGRRAIGIELDEQYAEVARKRLAQEVLFG